MLWCGRRTVGRMMGVRLGPGIGDEMVTLSPSLILKSLNGSDRPREGVEGRSDFSGDLGVVESRLPSIIRLISLTDAGWTEFIRRCVDPRSSDRSGDVSVIR